MLRTTVVAVTRFELVTLRVWTACSSQLSYTAATTNIIIACVYSFVNTFFKIFFIFFDFFRKATIHSRCEPRQTISWPPPNLSRFAWINSGKGVQHRRRWGGPAAILHYAANREWQNMLICDLSRLSLRLHLDPPKRWSVSTPLPKIRNADLGGRSRLHRQFRTAVPLK